MIDPVKDETCKRRLEYAAAEKFNTPKKIEKRLKSTLSVLTNEYRKVFKGAEFDGKDRLVALDGYHILLWENNGETSVGEVSVWRIKKQLKVSSFVDSGE